MKNAERTRLNTGTTRIAMGALLLLSLVGCVTRPMPALSNATLTPPTRTTRDLTHLPPPKGKIVAAVYGFRDLTGQYKASPDSSFSSQVTQGGASFLVKAMRDSGWFTPVERENLQDLLTERKIMRATDGADAKKAQNDAMAPLMPANIVLEGGIVGYDTNVRTGGPASPTRDQRVDAIPDRPSRSTCARSTSARASAQQRVDDQDRLLVSGRHGHLSLRRLQGPAAGGSRADT